MDDRHPDKDGSPKDLLPFPPRPYDSQAARQFLRAWDMEPRNRSLSFIPSDAAYRAKLAGAKAPLLLREALRVAMVENRTPFGLVLPEAIRAERERTFARIEDDIGNQRDSHFSLGRAAYRRDLAICRGALLPCGVEAGDPASGVPRRLLVSGGLRQGLAAAWHLLARCGGFRPFVELHFDRRDIQRFDAAGYTALYRNLADLLRANPRLRGVTSASWWHDPALGEAFDFIDGVPRQHGAAFFPVGEDAHATADALRFSPERQRLHAEGRYRPAVWMMVWPRRALLRWDEAGR